MELSTTFSNNTLRAAFKRSVIEAADDANGVDARSRRSITQQNGPRSGKRISRPEPALNVASECVFGNGKNADEQESYYSLLFQ